MDLRNKTASEFRTVFDSPLGGPNFQVPLYVPSSVSTKALVLLVLTSSMTHVLVGWEC